MHTYLDQPSLCKSANITSEENTFTPDIDCLQDTPSIENAKLLVQTASPHLELMP